MACGALPIHSPTITRLGNLGRRIQPVGGEPRIVPRHLRVMHLQAIDPAVLNPPEPPPLAAHLAQHVLQTLQLASSSK